jgi:hypothetical protein
MWYHMEDDLAVEHTLSRDTFEILFKDCGKDY